MKLVVDQGRLTVKANQDELLKMAIELIDLAKTAKRSPSYSSLVFENEGTCVDVVDSVIFERVE